MRGHKWMPVVATLLAVGACDDAPERIELVLPARPFGPNDIVTMRAERDTVPRGFGRLDLHVLLPPGTGVAAARTILQGLIDSSAAADTMLAAVRVTGFMLGRMQPDGLSAEVDPVMTATWLPIDSVGVVGRDRRAMFRTQFVLLGPLAAGADSQ